MKNVIIDWYKGEQLIRGFEFVGFFDTDIVEYYDEDLEMNVFKTDGVVVKQGEVTIHSEYISDEQILESLHADEIYLRKNQNIF